VLKELGGVFAAVGEYRRAIDLFTGLKDLNFDDRVRLVEFYNGDGDFAAAEAECNKLLAMRPGDRKVELMLADILSWRGNYTEALALLRRLRLAGPDTQELAIKMARIELWSRNYSAALEQFTRLLEADPNQPALWGEFVAAAAAAPSLDRRYRKPLMDLADKTLADKMQTDTQFLSRLAQALRTLKEPTIAAKLLQRAVDLEPTSRPLKLQFARTLVDAGRYDEAKIYFSALLPPEDQ
jgi:predicted Zn-dependent protease